MSEGLEQAHLIKPDTSSNNGNVFSASTFGLERRDLGGRTGRKFEMKVVNPRYRPDRQLGGVSETFTLFAKEHPDQDKDDLLELAAEYARLRSLKLPVPNTVRVLENDEGVFLVMTDFTEDGAYWVWGYNNNISPAEDKTLVEMELSQAELTEIEQQVIELVDQANKESVILYPWYYHVRKHKETGKLDVVLLDIETSPLPLRKVSSMNEDMAGQFMNDLLRQRIRDVRFAQHTGTSAVDTWVDEP